MTKRTYTILETAYGIESSNYAMTTGNKLGTVTIASRDESEIVETFLMTRYKKAMKFQGKSIRDFKEFVGSEIIVEELERRGWIKYWKEAPPHIVVFQK